MSETKEQREQRIEKARLDERRKHWAMLEALGRGPKCDKAEKEYNQVRSSNPEEFDRLVAEYRGGDLTRLMRPAC